MTMTKKLSLLAGLASLAATVQAQPAPELVTPKDKTSYAIGAQTARNFRKEGIDIDLDLVIRGIRDGMAGDRLLLSDKEIKQLMQGLLTEMRQKMVANRREAAERNRTRSEEFLAANKEREGIQVLPNGVQYRVITAGSGPRPGDGDTVLCRYRGTLLDGSEFDATPPDRQAALRIAQTIPGWREALKAMPVGSHWQVFIPPALAYGERGAGGDIGPNEVLNFDVELLGIQAPEKSAAVQ
ncbi:MAG: FKBP-type peptidyl-prolyl cis-trans isomerase N-terminal domain-containing protein [Actinomycetota bacterium]